MRDPRYIPERDRVRCHECREVIDAKAIGVAQLVMGWRVNRAKGANQIVDPEAIREWLCVQCLDAHRTKGHHEVRGQAGLF